MISHLLIAPLNWRPCCFDPCCYLRARCFLRCIVPPCNVLLMSRMEELRLILWLVGVEIFFVLEEMNWLKEQGLIRVLFVFPLHGSTGLTKNLAYTTTETNSVWCLIELLPSYILCFRCCWVGSCKGREPAWCLRSFLWRLQGTPSRRMTSFSTMILDLTDMLDL